MPVDRNPVTTAEEALSFDIKEVLEGYYDALGGATECGDNRTKAYWHGWRNGLADLSGKPDIAQTMLARDYQRAGAPIHPQLEERAPPRFKR